LGGGGASIFKLLRQTEKKSVKCGRSDCCPRA